MQIDEDLPPPPSTPVSSSSSHKRQRSVQTFEAGDKVDAMDLEGVWHEGVVKDVDVAQVCERRGDV